jgi:hypothetical protein
LTTTKTKKRFGRYQRIGISTSSVPNH